MCDGYYTAGKDDQPGLEDEFLCEYVDGTMDPVVQRVFEEYLSANPELQEHVDCLRNTRMLLCRYGCRCHAPRDLHDRLRRRISCDAADTKVPFHVVIADRMKGVATVTSAVALLLFLGVVGSYSGSETTDRSPKIVSAAVVGSYDHAPAAARLHDARAIIVIEGARYSPRLRSLASLNAVRSLVAAEIVDHPGLHPFDVNSGGRPGRSHIQP